MVLMFVRFPLIVIVVLLCGPFAASRCAADDPLASWHDREVKQAIIKFVTNVTEEGNADFVPRSKRIAVFDHDGTLWSEYPMYVQGAFAIDRVKALAEKNPNWKNTQPFKSVLEGNIAAIALTGQKGVMEIIAATHSGMTTDEFSQLVSDWMAKAEHPRYQRPYVECVFQPMLELIAYLKDNGFQTFIVSAGGVDFVRTFSERTYGIPPDQVIGSRMKTKYEVFDSGPVVMKLPELDFLCDHAAKPVAIQQMIGIRPVMAFGNSDGDFEMLEYTTTAEGPRFAALIHHTDQDREAAYDRFSIVGRLDRGLKESAKRGWWVVDMKHDWNRIFPDSSKR
jgi:phosphoserine phosphatase